MCTISLQERYAKTPNLFAFVCLFFHGHAFLPVPDVLGHAVRMFLVSQYLYLFISIYHYGFCHCVCDLRSWFFFILFCWTVGICPYKFWKVCRGLSQINYRRIDLIRCIPRIVYQWFACMLGLHLSLLEGVKPLKGEDRQSASSQSLVARLKTDKI